MVARGRDKLQYGEEDVDLGGIEQLVEVRQDAPLAPPSSLPPPSCRPTVYATPSHCRLSAAQGPHYLCHCAADILLLSSLPPSLPPSHQIGQTRAIGFAFQALAKLGSKPTSVRECVEAMEGWMEGGLDGLVGGGEGRMEAGKAQAVGNLARPRRFEIAAALNRFRSLQAKSEVVRP